MRPNPKLEDHPLSAVRDCLFNIFAAALHIGGRSSIHNLRTRHAAVTWTHLSRNIKFICVEKKNQLDVTECFIALKICSTYFGHFYAHHQEL